MAFPHLTQICPVWGQHCRKRLARVKKPVDTSTIVHSLLAAGSLCAHYSLLSMGTKWKEGLSNE